MAKRNSKVIISHPVDGVVRIRRYADQAQAQRSFERQRLGTGQRVSLVVCGDVIASRGNTTCQPGAHCHQGRA